MRKLFTTLLLTSFVLPLHAQRSISTSRDAVPPRLIATAEKEEKPEKPKTDKPAQSRSFLQRMFGPRPTPTPPPAPVVKNHPKPKPKPATDESTDETPKKVTPKAPSTGETPSTTGTTKPKTAKPVKKGAPTSTDGTALDDATKFKNAKTKALEDAHIKELKSRADGEVNEAEAQKALESYNRALFQKIREIDPSVGDYSGKVEQAMHRRLNAEKSKE